MNEIEAYDILRNGPRDIVGRLDIYSDELGNYTGKYLIKYGNSHVSSKEDSPAYSETSSEISEKETIEDVKAAFRKAHSKLRLSDSSIL